MYDFLIELQNQSIWDWLVLITGILYVVYAADNNPICWIWGIVSSGILAVVTVTKYGLYADGALNAFYVVMAFVGLYQWRSGNKGSNSNIERISRKSLLYYFIVGVFLSLICAKFLSHYTAAMATSIDSFTTVFSVIGTIWLVRRYLENWLLWIIVDAVYIYLYLSRGAILFGALYIVYTIISIKGYYGWRDKIAKSIHE